MNSARPNLAAAVFAGLASFAGTAAAQPLYDFILVDSFNADPRRGEAYLWDISDAGVACGVATVDNVIGYPGFVWEESAGKTLVPVSSPQCVSNAGLVAGNTSIYDLGTGQSYTPPNLPGTYYGPSFGGVNDAGVAVGTISGCSCSDSGGVLQVPYVWDAVNGARSVAVPNARGLSRVNSAGVAIGWLNGWVLNDGFFVDLATGSYTLMDDVFPPGVGAGPTRVFDINDAGAIVGSRQGTVAGMRYGYVYTPGAGVEILPFPGPGYQPWVTPQGINLAGTIVGVISTVQASQRAFVYTPAAGMRDLNSASLVAGIPAGYRLTSAQKINERGWIVGNGTTAAGKPTGYVLKARTPACPADFNGDGFLDFFDYNDFVGCFEGSVCPPGKTADFDGDGFADFFDYDAFVSAFEIGC